MGFKNNLSNFVHYVCTGQSQQYLWSSGRNMYQKLNFHYSDFHKHKKEGCERRDQGVWCHVPCDELLHSLLTLAFQNSIYYVSLFSYKMCKRHTWRSSDLRS